MVSAAQRECRSTRRTTCMVRRRNDLLSHRRAAASQLRNSMAGRMKPRNGRARHIDQTAWSAGAMAATILIQALDARGLQSLAVEKPAVVVIGGGVIGVCSALY